MDLVTPLRNITASSLLIPFAFNYALTRTTRFVLEPKFWFAAYGIWVTEFTLWAIYRVFIRPKYLSPLRKLPEPTEGRSSINGYAGKAYWGMRGSFIMHWNQILNHKGYFRYLGIFNSERLAFTSSATVSEVLTRSDEFIQPELLALLISPITGPGLVLLNGEEHKRQRKILSPSFSQKQIRDTHNIFWDKAVEITAKFTEMTEKSSGKASGWSEPFEIDYYAGLVGLDIISKAALGVDFESIQNPNSELVKNYRGTFEPTVIFQFLAFTRLLIPESWVRAIPHPRVQEGDRGIKLIKAVCLEAVHKIKDSHAKGTLDTHDIISNLVRDRGISDDDALVAHMMMMLGAGHETVTVGLTWSIYELCRRPEWQKILREEVREHLPSLDAGEMPSALAVDADKMPFLNAFISESLRYWPPAPQIVRTAQNDTTVGDVFVPASTKIQLSIVGFNRDPANWGPTADKFDPERWLTRNAETGAVTPNPNGGALNKMAFMTFIHGPRGCIGKTFARHEMLVVLACWIGRFEFLLADQTYMDEKNVAISGGGLTSKPLHGIHVCSRRIEGW